MYFSFQSTFSLSTIFVFVASVAAQPDSGQELLDFVREAHKASRESIRTCSCRVELTTVNRAAKVEKEQKQTSSGRYWYDSNSVRAKISDARGDEEYVWRDSTIEGLLRKTGSEGNIAGAFRSPRPYRYMPSCDAYIRGMFVFQIPESIKAVPFEQLVEQASHLNWAKWKQVGGKKMAVIGLHFDPPDEKQGEWDLEIYFDPSVNYLAQKSIYINDAGKNSSRNENEITQFTECSPSLFFPERGSGRSGKPDNWNFEHSTVISEIRVNQPLPENIFRMRYPYNVIMSDDTRGTTYRIDENGKRISSETPMAKAVIPPPSADLPTSGPNTETKEEPLSWYRWILPVSLAILVVGIVAAYLRRRRKQVVEA